MLVIFTSTAICILSSYSAHATTRTLTLAVPNMDCPVCPITLKKALTRLVGVNQMQVNFDKRQIIVIYDDSKIAVKAIIESTKNAGFPSTIVGGTQ